MYDMYLRLYAMHVLVCMYGIYVGMRCTYVCYVWFVIKFSPYVMYVSMYGMYVRVCM